MDKRKQIKPDIGKDDKPSAVNIIIEIRISRRGGGASGRNIFYLSSEQQKLVFRMAREREEIDASDEDDGVNGLAGGGFQRREFPLDGRPIPTNQTVYLRFMGWLHLSFFVIIASSRLLNTSIQCPA